MTRDVMSKLDQNFVPSVPAPRPRVSPLVPVGLHERLASLDALADDTEETAPTAIPAGMIDFAELGMDFHTEDEDLEPLVFVPSTPVPARVVGESRSVAAAEPRLSRVPQRPLRNPADEPLPLWVVFFGTAASTVFVVLFLLSLM